MRWIALLLALAPMDPPAEKAEDPKPEPVKSAKPEPANDAKPEPAKEAPDPAKAKDAPELPKPRRVVDRSYRPAPGDRAVLYSEDENGETFTVWATATPAAFREYAKAGVMEDEKRCQELEKQGSAIFLDDETPVGVMGLEPVVIPLNAERCAYDTVVTVRVLGGPHKGEVLLTSVDSITRFRTITEPAKGTRARKKARKSGATVKPADPAVKATVKPADPAARAAAQLRLGQGLEKAGKPAGAIEFYRKVVKDYPGTPQAKTAASRIDAIGGK